jgi:hypothetical protein
MKTEGNRSAHARRRNSDSFTRTLIMPQGDSLSAKLVPLKDAVDLDRRT